MLEDLAVKHPPHSKRPTPPAEVQPSIDLPRVSPRFLPHEEKDFVALFGTPDLPLARRYLREQLYHRGIREEVLNALDIAPRHVFIPARASLAYVDIAIQVDHTFVQAPSVVATVVSTLSNPETRVLELGTGTGYQSAVLAAFGALVTTIDSYSEQRLAAVDLRFGKLDLSIQTLVRATDPIEGIEGPFDLIVVNEALQRMPRRLIDLLQEDGGSIIVPIETADGTQRLMRYLRNKGLCISAVDLGPCFAPVSRRRPQ